MLQDHSTVSSLNVLNSTLTVNTTLFVEGSVSIASGKLTVTSPGLVIAGVSPIFAHVNCCLVKLKYLPGDFTIGPNGTADVYGYAVENAPIVVGGCLILDGKINVHVIRS